MLHTGQATWLAVPYAACTAGHHTAAFAALERVGGVEALTSQALVLLAHVGNGRNESRVGSLGCANRPLICQAQGHL